MYILIWYNKNEMLIKMPMKRGKSRNIEFFHLVNFLFLFFFHFFLLFFLLLIFNGRLFGSLTACSCLDLEVTLPVAMADFANGNGTDFGVSLVYRR